MSGFTHHSEHDWHCISCNGISMLRFKTLKTGSLHLAVHWAAYKSFRYLSGNICRMFDSHAHMQHQYIRVAGFLL